MPHNVARHDKSPKNKRNPKPSPIGNNFGFLSFGSPNWARTSDSCIPRSGIGRSEEMHQKIALHHAEVQIIPRAALSQSCALPTELLRKIVVHLQGLEPWTH